MRLPNEPTSKGLCRKMQTAEQFFKWISDNPSFSTEEALDKFASLSEEQKNRVTRIMREADSRLPA